jgi:hypothetical protein
MNWNAARRLGAAIRMRRRTHAAYRHLSYFLVRDALKEDGCAVCRLVIRWSERFLDGLLYESVTDPFVRARIREGQGFCNWHAWMLPKILTAASGVAAIHEDVMAREIEALRLAARSRYVMNWSDRLRAWLRRARPRRGPQCAACAISTETTEANSLHVLVESLAEPEFYQAFTESFGLCLPHLRMLEALHPDHPNLPSVRRIQLAKLDAMRAELLEFLRKQDYQHSHEPMGSEGNAWRRSIEMLVGKAHVFGPHRGPPWAEPQADASEATSSGESSAAEVGADVLRLRELVARLEKDGEAVRSQLNQATARIASLTFRLHEVEKDRQTLEMHLAGTRAGEETWRRIAAGLRAEMAQLNARLGDGTTSGLESDAAGANRNTAQKEL